MRSLVRFLILIVLMCACGKHIGDPCIVSSDCSPNGDRQCDPQTDTKDGYCTIMGCDYNTCPSEAVCVRFFTGEFDNKPCNHLTENDSTNDCSLDEFCDLEDHCVPRSSEIRYCMKTCDTSGDCRDGYECRDLNLMMEHGGEPVVAPGQSVDEHAPKFCASAPG